MKPNAKTEVVKVLFSPDDYLEFDKACNGEPHSSVLRKLAKNWFAARTNDRPVERRRERPQPVRNLAMFCPGRSASRVARPRL